VEDSDQMSDASEASSKSQKESDKSKGLTEKEKRELREKEKERKPETSEKDDESKSNEQKGTKRKRDDESKEEEESSSSESEDKKKTSKPKKKKRKRIVPERLTNRERRAYEKGKRIKKKIRIAGERVVGIDRDATFETQLKDLRKLLVTYHLTEEMTTKDLQKEKIKRSAGKEVALLKNDKIAKAVLEEKRQTRNKSANYYD